ncbi:hypothetical protein niasHT_022198 [Heterodera trifolii]|uniref:SET domain-containing protein n=1 Tax=Heterodera trifolii TaxID=157864 RepID=A0ABD2JNN4_9BILA
MEHDFGFGTSCGSSSLEEDKSGNNNNNRNGDGEERKIISVIIDEDEDEEEGEEGETTELAHQTEDIGQSAELAQQTEDNGSVALAPAPTSAPATEEEGGAEVAEPDNLSLTALNLDHDYVSSISQSAETPTNVASQTKRDFPVMHGINIDQIEEESNAVPAMPGTFSSPFLHVQRRAIKFPNYEAMDFYKQQHPKRALIGHPQKHLSSHHVAPTFISSAAALPQSLRQQRRLSPRLSSTYAPSSQHAPVGGWRGGQHGQQLHQAVHSAAQQRMSTALSAQTMARGGVGVGGAVHPNNHIGGSRPVSQIPSLVKRPYSTSATQMVKRQQQQHHFDERHHQQQHNLVMAAREQHNQQPQHTIADTMAEEDLQNEKFFSKLSGGQQQQSQQRTTTLRGRRPRKQQNEEIFDDAITTYQQQQQQESSKPPDDPIPPVDQHLPPHHRFSDQNQQHRHHQQYESSIDSAIDSVVRGDALVMQNFPAASAPVSSSSSIGFGISGCVAVTAPSPTFSSTTAITSVPQQQQQFIHPPYSTVNSVTTVSPLSPAKHQQHLVVDQSAQQPQKHYHYQQRHPNVPFATPRGDGTTMVQQHHHHRSAAHHHQYSSHGMAMGQPLARHSASLLPSTAGQSLEDLADLAQASSSLLQHTTSSLMRSSATASGPPSPPSQSLSAAGAVNHQQQLQQVQPVQAHQQQQQQPTMHFKVVATNDNGSGTHNQPEILYHPKEYRQQVFTVQQQREEEANIRIEQQRQHYPQQHHRPPVAKKLTKKQMATIQREFNELLPFGSTSGGGGAAAANASTLRQQMEKAAPIDGGTKLLQQQQPKKRGRTSKEAIGEIPTKNDGTDNDGLSVAERPARRSASAVGAKRSAEGESGQKLSDEGTTSKKKRIWEGADYVTRCICGMIHTDPFMIQCDLCDVWQHGVCMGIISKRAVPEQYFCEQCKPRELQLSASQAAAKQKTFLMSLPQPPTGARRGRKSNKFKLQQQQQQMLQQRRKRMLGSKPSNNNNTGNNSLKPVVAAPAPSQLGAVLRGERIVPKRRRGRPPRQQPQQSPPADVLDAASAAVHAKAGTLTDDDDDDDDDDDGGGAAVVVPSSSSNHRDSAASAMLLLREHNNSNVLMSDNTMTNSDDSGVNATAAATDDAAPVDEKPQQPTAKEVVVQPTPIENCYSRAVKALIAQLVPDSRAQLAALQRLKNSSPLTRQMYVAPNVEGLVATPGDQPISAGTLLIEYNGMISLLSEVQSRCPNKLNQQNFTLTYKGLGEGKELFVDATRVVSDARAVRKSCRPNAAVRHAISEGQIHIYLVATADIDKSNEVTIPFDSDYWDSCVPVSCACGFSKNPSSSSSSEAELPRCPVQEYNEALSSGDSAIFKAKKRLTRSFSTASAALSSGGPTTPRGGGTEQKQQLHQLNSTASSDRQTDKRQITKKESADGASVSADGMRTTKMASPIAKNETPKKKQQQPQQQLHEKHLHKDEDIAKLYAELCRILKQKYGNKTLITDFILPTEFGGERKRL